MKRTVVLALACMLSLAATSYAQEPSVEDLQRRVGELEKKVGDGKVAAEEPGHARLHPVHSVYGLTISGGVTVAAHGAKVESGPDPSAQGTISADLVVESQVGRNGRAVLVLDFQRGADMGLSFATAPNGAATGYNADLESFSHDTSVHLTQAYYEHGGDGMLSFSVGQLDITGYFDGNEFANDERSSFMAPLFVNNPAIEFGGSEDFYSLGARATIAPAENFSFTLGAFEGDGDGDGDYTDTFDKPFVMAEADLALKLFGMDGNYRLYYWYRNARPDFANTADPANAALAEVFNSGIGVSFDQMVSDSAGIWLRAGMQREQVARFDKFVSVGANFSGGCFGRENDAMGLGYGASFMSQVYENNKGAGFESAPEHYLELFYNYAVDNAGPGDGFHVTPDLQYVVNPGGDKNADSAFIYGVRLQAYF